MSILDARGSKTLTSERIRARSARRQPVDGRGPTPGAGGSDRVPRILGRHKGKEGAEVGTGLEFEEGFPPTFLYVSCLCFPG